MADTTKSTEVPEEQVSLKALTQLQEAGLGSILGMTTAWMETFGDMSAEVLGFVADRIKEDVKTQHQILHCKDVHELQKIQSKFVQTAIEQYQEETGKLVEMGTKAFSGSNGKDA